MSDKKGVLRIVSLATAGLLASVGLFATTSVAQAADEWNPESSYTTTDKGDGTYTVPLLNADVPDVSVERVPAPQNDEGRDIYYMISTTMHLSPGAPIMKSYDLVNWEIVNYVVRPAQHQRRVLAAERPELLRPGPVGVVAPLPRRHLLRAHQLATTSAEPSSTAPTTSRTERGEDGARPGPPRPVALLRRRDAARRTSSTARRTSAVRLNPTLTAIEQDFPNFFRRSDYAGPAVHRQQRALRGCAGLLHRRLLLRRDDHLAEQRSTGRHVPLDRAARPLAGSPAPYESRGVLNSNGFAQGSLVPIADDAGGGRLVRLLLPRHVPDRSHPGADPRHLEDGWPTFGNNGVVPVNGVFDKPIKLSPSRSASSGTRASSGPTTSTTMRRTGPTRTSSGRSRRRPTSTSR